jgi:mannonate dehydratase
MPHVKDAGWNLDELKRMKDDCDKAGVTFEAIRMDANYITLRKGPERDRELETIVGNIKKASEVGVKIITYHWTVIPIRRNAHTPGRGGVTYTSFKLEDDWKALPIEKSGRVSSDDYWERITTFLQTVIPVAKQHDVRMACHPYDPPGLPFGYQGADNWDAPSVFDAIKRYEAVRYLGERGKIYQIHMRNIRGGLYNFAEVFPDEGEMDFFEIMRILRDTQFGGSICPDHMPHHPDDKGGLQAFAFGYGYLNALIQAVNREV